MIYYLQFRLKCTCHLKISHYFDQLSKRQRCLITVKFPWIGETRKNNIKTSGQRNKSENGKQFLRLKPIRESNQAETVKHPVSNDNYQIVDARNRVVKQRSPRLYKQIFPLIIKLSLGERKNKSHLVSSRCKMKCVAHE